MRLYVIGGEGQVARSLREAAALDKNIVFGYGARPEVDLLHPSSIEKAIADFRPDVVDKSCSLYRGRQGRIGTRSGIRHQPRRCSRGCASGGADQGVPVIHLSTDYVFDGKKQGAYIESDPVAPQGVYGRSKLEGELAVAEANPKHIVLRTSWVYSPFGSNFVRTMLRLAAAAR